MPSQPDYRPIQLLELSPTSSRYTAVIHLTDGSPTVMLGTFQTLAQATAARLFFVRNNNRKPPADRLPIDEAIEVQALKGLLQSRTATTISKGVELDRALQLPGPQPLRKADIPTSWTAAERAEARKALRKPRKPWTPEARLKASESAKRRKPMSAATKQKLSAILKGNQRAKR